MPGSAGAGGGLGPGGVGRLSRPDVAQPNAARLAIALFLAIVGKPVADANSTVALRADKHHVGGIDRHLLGEPASLRVFLARAHMLVDPVDSLDDDLVPGGNHAE